MLFIFQTISNNQFHWDFLQTIWKPIVSGWRYTLQASNIHKKKKQYITGCKSCLNFRYKQYLANSGIGIALEDKIIRSTFDLIRDVSIYHRSKFQYLAGMRLSFGHIPSLLFPGIERVPTCHVLLKKYFRSPFWFDAVCGFTVIFFYENGLTVIQLLLINNVLFFFPSAEGFA